MIRQNGESCELCSYYSSALTLAKIGVIRPVTVKYFRVSVLILLSLTACGLLLSDFCLAVMSRNVTSVTES